MQKNIITTSNLTKIYYKQGNQEIKALDNVSLTVPRGEFLTILGPSGSGKTTLLNLIGGLDKPTKGNVILEGQEISKLNENQLVNIRREKVGFVFQIFNLIPTFSTLENIEAAMAPTDVPKNKKRKRVIELLNLVGLENRANHLPGELSSGEQQRVAIARALANKPSLLLLDEPTGNLDTKTGKKILKLCYKLCKNEGKTIIAVTHADYVTAYSDEFLYMRDGKVFSKKPR